MFSFVQAYTNELELEVAHLMEENARLRKQQEQVSVTVTRDLFCYSSQRSATNFKFSFQKFFKRCVNVLRYMVELLEKNLIV